MGQDILSTAPSTLYPLIIVILVALLLTTLGLVGWFLREMRESFRTEQKTQQQDIDKVRDDLAEFKASLPHQYVLRDDYVRTMINFDRKLDSMARDISSINKIIGGGTAKGESSECE
jgi:flagellar basal body-associated protein FliL